MNSYLSHVNPLQGTDSVHDFSTGNTLPVVARPWGMHHWTLQTGKTPWTFNSHLKRMQGFRLTHQPSPWMGDYGSLLIQPFVGEAMPRVKSQDSAYRLEDSTIKPHYLRTTLLRYGITVEMSPTERGAVFVFYFSTGEAPHVSFAFDGAKEIQWDGEKCIHGISRHNTGGVPENFGLHFHAEFSSAPEKFTPTEQGGHATFPKGTLKVEMRIAGSFINREMAQTSYRQELKGKCLDTIKSEGERIWNTLLGRIHVSDPNPVKIRTFYTCLYRCLLFPRFLTEIDEAGAEIHYSPYNGKILKGKLCTDTGFWDTYRTLYPLLIAIYPDIMRQMLDGWMNVCREAGWAPKWVSPGLRDCMIGTHFDVIAADAVTKGIDDWDVEEAFSYLWKDATVPSDRGAYGRQELADYLRYGYVPIDKHGHATACTLDYAYDDFCVAQVAKFLGKEMETELLSKRSKNYKNVFDSSIGFMRGRLSDGKWLSPFHEFEWGGPFIEGGTWQHTFNVPHDYEGLAQLFGGKYALSRKLDLMLSTPPRYEVGEYKFEIHEMTEMAVVPFGQYAQSNQPVHAFLFTYILIGETEKAEYWIHKVCSELYSPDILPGDEDNGEMSAWYVWASLGLYPYCPGIPEYVTFAPYVESAEIHIPTKIGSLRTGENSSIPRGTKISHRDLFL